MNERLVSFFLTIDAVRRAAKFKHRYLNDMLLYNGNQNLYFGLKIQMAATIPILRIGPDALEDRLLKIFRGRPFKSVDGIALMHILTSRMSLLIRLPN